MSSNKAIYKPTGRAREYAAFACNFHLGCRNRCDYCYLKRFPLLSGNEPVLRKVFDSEAHALAEFEHDLRDRKGNVREDLRREGVTFSFTTDPLQDGCVDLTAAALRVCLDNDVPAMVLTKCVGWTLNKQMRAVLAHPMARTLLAIGFTITGEDGREPHVDTNEMRLVAMKDLHEKGYVTYASIEPVFFYDTALKVVEDCAPYARLLKIGLMSGSRKCVDDTVTFINRVREIVSGYETKVYWKQSIRDCVGGGSPIGANFVEYDWNIFGR